MLSIFDVFVGVNWCSSNILVFHGYIIAIFAIFAHLPRIIICSLCIPEYMFASELFCYSIWIGAIWEVTLLRIRCSFLPFLLLMFGSTSIFSRIPQLYLKWYQNCWRIVIFFKLSMSCVWTQWLTIEGFLAPGAVFYSVLRNGAVFYSVLRESCAVFYSVLRKNARCFILC